MSYCNCRITSAFVFRNQIYKSYKCGKVKQYYHNLNPYGIKGSYHAVLDNNTIISYHKNSLSKKVIIDDIPTDTELEKDIRPYIHQFFSKYRWKVISMEKSGVNKILLMVWVYKYGEKKCRTDQSYLYLVNYNLNTKKFDIENFYDLYLRIARNYKKFESTKFRLRNGLLTNDYLYIVLCNGEKCSIYKINRTNHFYYNSIEFLGNIYALNVSLYKNNDLYAIIEENKKTYNKPLNDVLISE
jgi:hypothetical protein